MDTPVVHSILRDHLRRELEPALKQIGQAKWPERIKASQLHKYPPKEGAKRLARESPLIEESYSNHLKLHKFAAKVRAPSFGSWYKTVWWTFIRKSQVQNGEYFTMPLAEQTTLVSETVAIAAGTCVSSMKYYDRDGVAVKRPVRRDDISQVSMHSASMATIQGDLVSRFGGSRIYGGGGGQSLFTAPQDSASLAEVSRDFVPPPKRERVSSPVKSPQSLDDDVKASVVGGESKSSLAPSSIAQDIKSKSQQSDYGSGSMGREEEEGQEEVPPCILSGADSLKSEKSLKRSDKSIVEVKVVPPEVVPEAPPRPVCDLIL